MGAWRWTSKGEREERKKRAVMWEGVKEEGEKWDVR